MNLSLVTLLSFAGLASITAAVLLVVRDLFGRGPQQAPAVVRRLPLARDEHQPQGFTGQIDQSFGRLVLQSGIDTSPLTAFLVLVVCGLILGGIFFLLSGDDNPWPAAVGMIIGMAIPLVYFIYRRNRHIRMLQTQLAEVLDLLARAVRAGESLDQAIQLVGQKSEEPLAREFRRVSKHLEMGLSVPAAVRALAFRVPIMEMRIFATTLAVHRQTGGNLPVTLERMAAVVRDRLDYRRQLRVSTAAGRFSTLLIASAGPLLFAYMFIFQRAYVRNLLDQPLGQSLLAAAIVLEIIGLVWVLSMLRPEN